MKDGLYPTANATLSLEECGKCTLFIFASQHAKLGTGHTGMPDLE